MKTFLEYGRYDDDSTHVGCPRAKTDMTPCVARDGQTAIDNSGFCVGCGCSPAEALKELVYEVTDLDRIDDFVVRFLSECYLSVQSDG